MRETVMAGVGMHPFGRFEGKPYTQMALEAVLMALKDANVPWKDVQAAYCSSVFCPATSGLKILTPLGLTGIPITNVEAACASGGSSIMIAQQAIATGLYDVVLALGVDKMPRGFISPEALGEKWQVLAGMVSGPMNFALNARRHMYEYGTTVEQMAKVSVKAHKNGVFNPYAMYRKELSFEEIMNSQVVADPIRRLMFCAPNEGAAAAVLCSRDVAKKYTDVRRCPEVASAVVKTAAYPGFPVMPYYSFSTKKKLVSPVKLAAREAYEKAGIGPKDLDVVELQDTDAASEINLYEQLDLCNEGEGGRLVDEGATEISGSIPVNPSGGLLCKGEPVGASGLGQVAEIVWQLRGEAGKRQVAKPKVGMSQVVGNGGICAVVILKN